MFGEDESESPRQPSPWQSHSSSSSPQRHLYRTPPTPTTPSARLPRRASYLDRLAIEACATVSPSPPSSSLSLAGNGIGVGPVGSSETLLALSLEAEALRFEGGGWRDEGLVPEVDELGHIEYKLKIVAPTPSRFQKLTTQLKWRLLEGGGMALYEIGVLDNGELVGLSPAEIAESLANLGRMATELGADVRLGRVVELPEIMIRTEPVGGNASSPGEDGDGWDQASTEPGGSRGKPRVPGFPRPRAMMKKKPMVKPGSGLSGGTGAGESPPRGKGKPRIEPGDAAVSSDSDEDETRGHGTCPASEAGREGTNMSGPIPVKPPVQGHLGGSGAAKLVSDSTTALAGSTCTTTSTPLSSLEDAIPDMGNLASALPPSPSSSPHPIPPVDPVPTALGRKTRKVFLSDDPICAITPEERYSIRRQRRDEQRATKKTAQRTAATRGFSGLRDDTATGWLGYAAGPAVDGSGSETDGSKLTGRTLTSESSQASWFASGTETPPSDDGSAPASASDEIGRAHV